MTNTCPDCYEIGVIRNSESPKLVDLCPRHAEAQTLVERLQKIVNDLTDPDPCSFDHHGYCQAHGWFDVEPKCPHARAKELAQ